VTLASKKVDLLVPTLVMQAAWKVKASFSNISTYHGTMTPTSQQRQAMPPLKRLKPCYFSNHNPSPSRLHLSPTLLYLLLAQRLHLHNLNTHTQAISTFNLLMSTRQKRQDKPPSSSSRSSPESLQSASRLSFYVALPSAQHLYA
jgi:hypothetical protein